MKLPMVVRVMPKDIKLGKRDDVAACPIALAFRRKFKKLEFLEVTCHVVSFSFDEDEMADSFALTQPVRDWIDKFDDGGARKVKPLMLKISKDKKVRIVRK